MFRSTSFRLAVLYTAAFALAVVALGAITFFAMRAELSKQFDTRIRAESAALVQEYLTEGLDGVVNAVHERDRTPGALGLCRIGTLAAFRDGHRGRRLVLPASLPQPVCRVEELGVIGLRREIAIDARDKLGGGRTGPPDAAVRVPRRGLASSHGVVAPPSLEFCVFLP